MGRLYHTFKIREYLISASFISIYEFISSQSKKKKEKKPKLVKEELWPLKLKLMEKSCSHPDTYNVQTRSRWVYVVSHSDAKKKKNARLMKKKKKCWVKQVWSVTVVEVNL